MDYLDFDIEIGVGSGRDYPLAVIRSAGGEARETMHFPFDELALESRLKDVQIALLRSGGKRRQIQAPEELAVQDFGRALFGALFTGEVRSRYAVSQREAFHQGKGLRVRLRIRAPELATLPWEFLYDANQSEYLCLSSNTPVVRYLELPHPPQPLLVTPPLSILGMASSPTNLAELDIEREKVRLETALKDLQTNGLVKLHWLEGRSWYHLQRAMRRGPWHIFHFIGHGDFDTTSDEGLIALEDEEGKAHLLSATHLGRLLTDHRSLRLIVLNSCLGARGSERDIFSSTAAILVRRGMPAVMAMQYEITDRAAIELSRTFYEALADGLPVDTAVSEARKAISIGIARTLEWGTPVLYMRSPDGKLFDMQVGESLTTPRPMTRTEEFALLFTLTGHSDKVNSVAISPDGRLLVSGSSDKTIKVWDLHSGDLLRTLTGHSDQVDSVAISPDGQLLVSSDEMIKVWDLHSGDLLRTLTDHSDLIHKIAISPDGQLLVSSGGDRTIKVWDLHSGDLLHTLTGHTGPFLNLVESVAISPDGQLLVSNSSHTVKVWDLHSGDLLRTLRDHSNLVGMVTISPDGQLLINSSYDTIEVWDLHSGDLLRTLTGHSAWVQSVAISLDGRLLVSGSSDETIKVWDLHSGDLLHTLTGHSTWGHMVIISPKGRLLISGVYDKTIKVWDLHSGDLLRTLTGHSDQINSLTISPDGQLLVSGSSDKTIKVWGKK